MKYSHLILLVLLATAPLGCAPAAPEAAARSNVREVWDVVFLQQARVGYRHLHVEPETTDGQQLVKVTTEMQFDVLRAGQRIQQQTSTTSWESPQGRLIRFETKAQLGNEPTVVRGHVDGRELKLETVQAGRSVPSKVAWPEDGDGPEAVELSLERKPMQAGQRRRVVSLAPILNQPAVTELVAVGMEATSLLTGTYELLRIDAVTQLTGLTIHGKLWTDAQGNVIKQWVQEPLEQTSYRVSRDEALGSGQPGNFDLTLATNILLKGKLPRDLHAAQESKYRVRMKDDDPAKLFAVGQSQQVTSTAATIAEVSVRAIRPETPLVPLITELPPTSDDLLGSALVQIDAPKVIELATTAAPAGGDEWKAAVTLEQFVHRKIKNKNFSLALASAAEVADHLEGDCTEHAVLLTALLRARKIPARVALGVVYVPSQKSLVFHMWTEAFVAGRWIPLDATLGQGGIGAGHLKLAHSSLADGTALLSFMNVAKVLGRLQVELLDEK